MAAFAFSDAWPRPEIGRSGATSSGGQNRKRTNMSPPAERILHGSLSPPQARGRANPGPGMIVPSLQFVIIVVILFSSAFLLHRDVNFDFSLLVIYNNKSFRLIYYVKGKLFNKKEKNNFELIVPFGI